MYIVQSFDYTDSHKIKIILNHILSSNTKKAKADISPTVESVYRLY